MTKLEIEHTQKNKLNEFARLEEADGFAVCFLLLFKLDKAGQAYYNI